MSSDLHMFTVVWACDHTTPPHTTTHRDVHRTKHTYTHEHTPHTYSRMHTSHTCSILSSHIYPEHMHTHVYIHICTLYKARMHVHTHTHHTLPHSDCKHTDIHTNIHRQAHTTLYNECEPVKGNIIYCSQTISSIIITWSVAWTCEFLWGEASRQWGSSQIRSYREESIQSGMCTFWNFSFFTSQWRCPMPFPLLPCLPSLIFVFYS